MSFPHRVVDCQRIWTLNVRTTAHAREIGKGKGNHGKGNPANAKGWGTSTRWFQRPSHVRPTMGPHRMLATRILRWAHWYFMLQVVMLTMSYTVGARASTL